MRAWLAALSARFRAWRTANREAHRARAQNAACCAAPDSVYAQRGTTLRKPRGRR